MKKLAIACAATLICSPLAAQDAEEPATVDEAEASGEEGQDAEATDGEDRIICRRTAIVGSKFKKKVCGTQEMWESLSNRGKATTKEFQSRGRNIRQAGG